MGILISIGFCSLIILIIYVFSKALKDIYPKSIWIFRIVSIIIVIDLFYHINNRERIFGDEKIDAFIGYYKIDIVNSKYNSVDLNNYKDLGLIVDRNHTFHFTKANPFFYQISGKWQHYDDGDISWTEISLIEDAYFNANIDKNFWEFNDAFLKSKDPKNKIIFTR